MYNGAVVGEHVTHKFEGAEGGIGDALQGARSSSIELKICIQATLETRLIMAESIGDGTALVAIGGARRAEWEGDKPSSNIVRSAVVGTSTAGSWLN